MTMTRATRAAAVLSGGLLAAIVVSLSMRGSAAGAQSDAAFKPPRGLESMPIPVPADNPMTAARIALGKQLFFDTRLSRTKKMSCETCHVPEKGWTDGLSLSPRFDGSMNTRHTPTLYGVAYYPDLYWDGRAKGLEAQILAAWRSQMGADPDAIAKDVQGVPAYAKAFEAEFGGPASGDRIVKALATFVRTIHAGDTAWDSTPQGEAALKTTAIGRGFIVFSETAKCTLCHLPPLFSDTLFHNVGIGFDKPNPDLGRGKNLLDTAAKNNQPAPPDAEKLTGAFKTPSLRGVTLSGPYFHDGGAKTLEEAVDVLLNGGVKNAHLDEKLQKWPVTAQQRTQLLTFLRALTPKNTKFERPKLP
ncbi:MAG TPA: cytochrome c peroxidase [Vicinamibacterales bacterium]|jgi:cytochrome c peroxidase|nr:cytochrome c peroxidase [Vicinamibacterales bacterium]